MSQSAIRSAMHKVGFITPPGWFDISPMEFMCIAPANTIVMQTTMRPHDFDYSPEHVRSAVGELGLCARSLAAAGAAVVAQFGYPFSFVHGWPEAQRVQETIEQDVQTPIVMMGVEVIYALRHVGCKSVAVAATYYSDAMAERLLGYLAQAGVNVSHCQNWQSQGLVAPSATGTFVGQGELDPMGWETPAWAVEEAVRKVARSAPEADCVLVTGGGMRLLNLADALEKEVGRPIVAGDLTLYWGILRRLGIETGIKGHGRLLASLGQGGAPANGWKRQDARKEST